jgi:hypothetical protein|tara:strand:- start:87 stop:614 length:528 start_codon:yes stop_codon:yes gene_type:complete
MNLSNDWIRRDVVDASTVYYGYTNNEETADSSKEWIILKLSTVGTVDSVYWSNNSRISYISSWNQRVQSFNPPTGPLSITYSITNITPSDIFLDLSWNYLLGVDRYKISITDQNNILYNSTNTPFVSSPYTLERLTNITYLNKYRFTGKRNMTYNVSITGVNMAGASSSNVSIST